MLINLPRAQSYLNAARLDAVVATSWPNVLYCSGYYLWLQPLFKEYMARPGAANETTPVFAIVTTRGDLILVLDHGWELNAAESWASEKVTFGPPLISSKPADAAELEPGDFRRSRHRYVEPAEALAGALNSVGLADGRIGLEAQGLSLVREAAVKAALPKATISDCSSLCHLVRMVKSDSEQTRLRRAAEINQQAAAQCLADAFPGCQIQDLAQRFRACVAAAGADFDHFAFSQRGVGLATENRYCLGARETMFVDFGCVYQHYYSDAGVTLISGDCSRRELDAYHTLVDCLNVAAHYLRPGVAASVIQARMQQVFDAAGLGGNFPHGHGIGIELRDYPILVPDEGRRIRDQCVDVPADVPLESGMIINLEAPVYEWHGAAMQLEQSYLVTADGGKALTNRDLTNPVFTQG